MKFFSNNKVERACIILLYFVLVVLIATLVIAFSRSRPKLTNNELRTDTKALEAMYPGLGHIEKCYWKLKVYGSSRLAVGPTRYWIRGFAILDPDTLKSFKENFKWTNMSADWRPYFETDILPYNSSKWSYSNEFNKYIGQYEAVQYFIDFDNSMVCFEYQN